MIVVALMSSIIGGSVVGGFFMFGIPALKSPVQSILGNGAIGENDSDSVISKTSRTCTGK